MRSGILGKAESGPIRREPNPRIQPGVRPHVQSDLENPVYSICVGRNCQSLLLPHRRTSLRAPPPLRRVPPTTSTSPTAPQGETWRITAETTFLASRTRRPSRTDKTTLSA